jgi:hypothetical protein
MTVTKRNDGTLELALTGQELEWLGQTLNECCNGFGVKDCKGTLGADENVLQSMLKRIGEMYQAPIGHEG